MLILQHLSTLKIISSLQNPTPSLYVSSNIACSHPSHQNILFLALYSAASFNTEFAEIRQLSNWQLEYDSALTGKTSFLYRTT